MQADFRHITKNLLGSLGLAGPGSEWQAQGWQVFIQAESVNKVPSRLVPVKLLLRFETAPDGPVQTPQFEERQVAEARVASTAGAP